MGLNQILQNEQITLMQHAAATDPSEIREHRRQLGRFAGKLSLFAYPHRPYVSPSAAPTAAVDPEAKMPMPKPKGRL